VNMYTTKMRSSDGVLKFLISVVALTEATTVEWEQYVACG